MNIRYPIYEGVYRILTLKRCIFGLKIDKIAVEADSLPP